MQSIHLAGAEDVRQAGASMLRAADDMRNAASTISAALDAHQAFLTRWLEEYRAIMQPPPPEPVPAGGPDPAAWREWKGGFCPAVVNAQVWVKQKDGQVLKAVANDVQWRQFKGANYVVAWQYA